MGEADIHFPTGQRRDKPKFEPPPWERQRFEELERRAPEVEPAAEDVTASSTQEPLDAEAARNPESPALDAKQVELLMMGLRAEEPRPEETFTKVTAAVGVACAVLGLALLTWGFIALATPKQSGAGATYLVGGLILFGFGFIGGGAWVVIRSLRQQGVL